MKSELKAGLELIQQNCSRGMVVVDANVGGSTVYVTLVVPKDEQVGLLDKMRTMEPFDELRQFISCDVADLPFWKCRLNKYYGFVRP